MQRRLFQAIFGSFLFLGLTTLGALATDVTTLAGNGTAGTTDGTGGAAKFYNPSGADVDSGNNAFVADSVYHLIRKVTPAGVVTTFAGDASSGATNSMTGTLAKFNNPYDTVVDSNNHIFVADYTNHTIRRISDNGEVFTFAGNPGTTGYVDGVRGAARFYYPSGLGIDNGDNIYVADSANNRIRKITPNGVVTTIAGNGSAVTIDDTGTAAGFNSPYDVVMASNGNLFVAEAGSHTIRKITSGGVVTTFAGTVGATGTTDDTGTAASFNTPSYITADSSDNLFVADYGNHTIRKITQAAVVTTPTGTATVSGAADGALASATYNNPRGMTIMSNGAILLADYNNHEIRKIINLASGKGSPYGSPATMPSGSVVTLAGNGSTGSVDGTGAAATFYNPVGVDVDSSGNLFVGDSVYHLIRKVTPAGVVTTFAGDGNSGNTDSYTGTVARFNNPYDIVVDSHNHVFVADYTNHTIRRITDNGEVFTFAGHPGTSGYVDGVRGAARFYYPTGLGIDNGDNIYVADSANNRIRKITPEGVVTTIAGNGDAEDFNNASALSASFSAPYDVVMASTGDLYVADSGNHLIRKIVVGGAVTTLAGNSGVTGGLDATGTSAKFNAPYFITAANGDSLFVSDYGNHSIRKVTLAGVVTTPTGSAGDYDNFNGPIYRSLYHNTAGMTIMSNGRALLADYNNHEIRKITGLATAKRSPYGSPAAVTSGTVTTLAGNGTAGTTNGTGGAANFYGPVGADVDSGGNLFIADSVYHLIRKITPAGVVTTFAGTGSSGSTDDTGTAASFNNPYDIVIDSGDNLFVADYTNHTIRKITPAGVVTTFAGTAGATGSTNDTGAAARFYYPTGLGIDASNNLYVADSANHTIRKITTGAVVTTLAGSAGLTGSDNGTGAAARFSTPIDVVVASTGDLYVTDSGNSTIRKVTTGGVVTKLAGTTGTSAEKDATGINAKFTSPSYIAADGNDNLFVTDSTSHVIRKVTLAGVVTTPGGSGGDDGYLEGEVYRSLYYTPQGLTVNSSCDILLADYNNQRIRKISNLATGCTTAYRRRIIISHLKDFIKPFTNLLISHQAQE